MSRKSTTRRPTGMTLLEVLIAMTLMVIISAISYASLNALIDAKIHTDKVADNLRLELLVSQQLNKDVAALIERTIKGQYGDIKPAVIGNFSSIEFSRNGHANPLKHNRANLQRVKWYVRDNKLYRSTIDYLDAGSFPKWQVREYLENISELNINFINTVGVESRQWPIANSVLPLKAIQFTLVYRDNTSLKFFMSVVN
ncbi:MAG: type II secretion system minor pseudopilin GspJ [Proteobacteria bacterium]|nr:type II secretion system minor pseudopilin GspJ [Pseudomonadota bacterium]